MTLRFCFCWVSGLLFLATSTFGQEMDKNFSARFTNQQLDSTLFLGGNVDFNNTFVHLPENYMDQFSYLQAYQVYQNLQSIVLKNLGHHALRRPFISINNSEFWMEPSDVVKNLEFDSANFDNSSISLWDCITNKVLHRIYPYFYGDNMYREGTPVELTSVFGYGFCYNKASAIARLPNNENNFFYGMLWDKHSVPDYKVGNRSAVIDTDLKSFYWNLNNNKLSNRSAAANDRHLIRRTHHFGRQYMYDKRVNEYVANLYSVNLFPIPQNNSNLNNLPYSLSNYAAGVFPNYFSLDYLLLPGEVMILDYSPAVAWFADGYYQGIVSELANGRFTYDWDSSITNSLVQPKNLTNLQVDQWLDAGVSKSRLVKTDSTQSASLNFSLQHGFQVVLFELTLEFDRNISSTDGSITVQLSNDSATWIMPTTQSINDNQVTSNFNLQKTPFNYRRGTVYVKVIINEKLQTALNNFSYTSHFQINRLSLPQLKCGNNVIKIAHNPQDTDINLQADITYKERTDTPPEKITNPLHPKDKEVVYGYVNKIQWTQSEDVVNYEFLLTTDTLKEMPLAPNFTSYTSGPSLANLASDLFNKDNNINASGRSKDGGTEPKKYWMNPAAYIQSKPQGKREVYFQQSEAKKKDINTINEFIINEEGFLNSDNTYFWKVRPLNSDGIWGPWSNYFSFTMKKVMHPTNLQISLSDKDEVLSWTENANGLKPNKFEVYASDEYAGFEPSTTNLWATTEGKQISILNCPYTFFRVIAVDPDGYRSETSEYINRAYPYLTNSPKQIYADSIFKFHFSFNPFYIPFVSESDEYYEIKDEISFSIDKMPSWLTYNSSDSTVTGKTEEEVLKEEFYTGKNSIELEVSSKYLLPVLTRKIKIDLDYQIKNNKPVIEGIDTVVFTNNEISFPISYSDEDEVYGDSVSLNIDNTSDWLNYDYDVVNNKVLFSGHPVTVGKAKTTLGGRDKYGDTTRAVVAIDVVSNIINYTVTFVGNEPLKIELKSLPFHKSIVVDESHFSLGQVELTYFDIQLINNILIINGNFCDIENQRILTIPITALINGSEVHFQIVLNLRRGNLANSILAFHPLGTSNIVLENTYCGDSDVHYWIIDINGRILMSQEIQMVQQQTSQINIAKLSPGVYVFRVISQGKLINFRFIKT